MSTTIAIPRTAGGAIILVIGAPRVLKITLSAPKQHVTVSLAAPKQHLTLKLAALKQHLTLAFSEVAMTTPNTTIDSSATLTDQNGALITSVSSATLTVTYQDGSTATPTVTNMGSGVYTATYTTKGIKHEDVACPFCNKSKRDRLPHEWPEGGRLL